MAGTRRNYAIPATRETAGTGRAKAMTIHYRPPALSAAAKMNRMNKTIVAVRKATRAASRQAADNAEAAARRERGEPDTEQGDE
jgi:hypothetical protein